MRWVFPVVGAAAVAVAAALPGEPEKAEAQCSVLSRHPCMPYNCGVYSRPGCLPWPAFPLNEVPVLRVKGHVGPSEPLDRDHPADRISEMGPILSTCLELPPADKVRTGMRVTLKFAFKRDGELLAPPRFTYTTHEAPPDIKAAYREAALDMLKRCTPLPITDSLGRAIAGRPFVVPIIEARTEQKQTPGEDKQPGGPAHVGGVDTPGKQP
jgi:hypothetical protein